ncbi:hypothetical protein B9Q11_03235 [Candidatus Marsarchaeota G2 archaeon ECH_B_SAG-F08]|uniref:Isopentenyl phosphate kinase n=1 Tax=Candidatus Marsarchaeota G2 archaeon ECH_B_SAG-F08 TaxID=1978165 RepID=A0A2R6BGX7_9ARCH|nr:MAG: hypothetical protein B9Q11_03235 [Candidatus Marsarchaeota G2 archaeon ECH_B_SAG-F08]
MMKNVVVVKLGGSVITYKHKSARGVNTHNLERVIAEMAETRKNLVVIHGGGSFGHSVALKNKVQFGKPISNNKGASETMLSMLELNKVVLEEMLKNGFAPISFPPHSFVLDKRIKKPFWQIFERAISEGFTPVTYGDVVLDQKTGFTIISGDQLASQLAIQLKAETLIFATAVDGVYKDYKSKNLIEVVDQYTNFKSITKDATGGIKNKVEQALLAAKAGVNTLILNATKPGLLKKAILNEEVKCSKIVWRNHGIQTS